MMDTEEDTHNGGLISTRAVLVALCVGIFTLYVCKYMHVLCIYKIRIIKCIFKAVSIAAVEYYERDKLAILLFCMYVWIS